MNLVLPTYSFEAFTEDFMFRGTFQPRGELMTFANDPRYIFHTFNEVEMFPITGSYQVNCIRQPVMNVAREKITFLALQKKEDAQRVQILAAKRPAIFYTNNFALRGFIHANSDFADNDLIDDSRDFVGLTDVTIYPLVQINCPANLQVPIVVINRHQATAYHVYKQ
jgi:hypothetical protein